MDNIFSYAPEACNGCKILQEKKPSHCLEDYEDPEHAEVLLVSDSYKWFGFASAFSDAEYKLIIEILSELGLDLSKVSSIASINCPRVTENQLNAASMNICRGHLVKAVNGIKPKMILAFGNLAFKMLTKKSGIAKHRGEHFELAKEFDYRDCIVIPVTHPFSVIKEPKNRNIFEVDLRNAVYHYTGNAPIMDFSYEHITSIEQLKKWWAKARDQKLFAVDLETTGLNFLKDKIHTVAISSEGLNVGFAIDHKDASWSDKDKKIMLNFLTKFLEDPNKRKVFHNAKFDLKFLMNYGIYPQNVACSKVLAKIVDENRPNSLKNLVNEYFGVELG
jgi:uracil-DNA glycosylase family 4